MGPYTGTLCHVLQYLSSAFGLAVLALWYRHLPAPLTASASAGGARSAALPVLLLVAVAALLIGSVQATETFAHSSQIYRTLDVFLTHGLAWFALLYLVAGTILTLEQTHERSSV
jgi:methenyltetrahydromethanopterin cyclohydrolase